MKKIFMGLALLLTGSLSVQSQGLDGLVVEKFYVTNAADNAGSGSTATPLPTGSVVWRFYADLAPGYQLLNVYGDGVNPLEITTTTSFFNNTDRGDVYGASIAGNQIQNNTVYIDSYVSLGATATNRGGLPKTDDDNTSNIAFVGGYLQNNDASAGFPLTVRDGSTSGTVPVVLPGAIGLPSLNLFATTPAAGNSVSTNSGAWFAPPGTGAQGYTTDNKVLIAQITSNGVLTYSFNFSIQEISTGITQAYVHSGVNPVDPTTQIVVPALAGVVNQPNPLPSVSITAPAGGSTYLVGQTVTIDATATDVAPGTITNVEFLVDGNVVGSSNIAPYTFNWTSTVGAHVLTARATDDLGGQTTSAGVNILVGNVIPPTVSITAPVSGTTFVLGDIATINATAADADGTVTGVEFFVNGVSIGNSVVAPYTVNWPVVIGNAVLTAVATDDDNTTTTSAPINVTVFDSSSAYVIVSATGACSVNNFCLPIQAIVPVDDVIGYDIVLQFDNTKVTPTGVVSVASDLINPSLTSTANSIDNANGLMYISVFFNASAPIEAEFTGVGRLLCVEFARTAGFSANDVANFTVTSLQESYINGVQPKVVSPGSYTTFQETEYNSSLKFWFDNSPIRYNSADPAQYLITNIYGDNSTCSALSATAIQPDLAGNFEYDVTNGTSINIQKDILNTTSVQPVVNGFDAFLTRRVLINDATFVPSVYQIIAMDVNTDGVISAGDLSQINQRAVLVIGEFRQDWNYSSGGVSNGQASKDWLFIDGTTLTSDPAFQISANYPFPDATGYSKSNVPDLAFCLPVPTFTSAACQTFGLESYTGILIGDVNGNYATVVPNSAFRSDASEKVSFDLTKAVIVDGSIEIPVEITSAGNVNALDFALQYNQSKLTFQSIITYDENMEAVSHQNSNDQVVRFTSFNLQNFDLNKTNAAVRFAINSESIEISDLNSVEAFLNGERVVAEVIGNRIAENNGVLMSLFPNPSSTMFNIVVSEEASFELMDLNGKIVASETALVAMQNYEISTENLSNGVYMLRVFNNNSVSVKKVVVKK